jgi:hypothetical protein
MIRQSAFAIPLEHQDVVDCMIEAMNRKLTLQCAVPIGGIMTFKIRAAWTDLRQSAAWFGVDAMFSEDVEGVGTIDSYDTHIKILWPEGSPT